MLTSLVVTYATFKQVAAHLPVYYTMRDVGYFAICTSDGQLFRCFVQESADIADFDATLKPDATEAASPDDATALALIPSIIEPGKPQGVSLQDKTGVDTAVVSGVPVTLPNLFPIGVAIDIIGAGDSSTVRGAGAQFHMEAGDDPVEWQYIDWVMLAGGGVSFDSAQIGDHIDMDVSAPASTVTAASGGNTGNCNLVDPGVGAAILIVPAAGDGAYNVDLSTAVPVPAPYDSSADTYSGYYDWSDPPTGSGTVSVGTPGQAWWNLFAANIPLTNYATKFQLLGSRSANLTLPAVKPGKILPQWKSRVALTPTSGSAVKVCWYLITARMRTV